MCDFKLRIILAYSRNLQDIAIPPQIQTMCVKLLLGLADNLVAQPSKPEGNHFADISAITANSNFRILCVPTYGSSRHVPYRVKVS